MQFASPLTLTAADGWERVTTGASGAVVLRSVDGSCYAKYVPVEQRHVLDAERDRIDWARRHDVPTTPVLDWGTTSEWARLVTATVPGVPASALPPPALWRAWPSIADAVRQLHALRAEACPFDRDLADMFARAEDVVGRGAAHPEFLPPAFRDTQPDELLAQLASERSRRSAEEDADLVVCHGDLCLPNVIIDPETHAVTGLVDLGRLGRADRYADIALLLANSRGTWADEEQAVAADVLFADRYGIALAADRRQFYLCLDALTW